MIIQINKKIITITILTSICLLLQLFSFTEYNLVGISSGTRTELYDFELNITKTEQTTEGSSPIEYAITLINTGNAIDTVTLFTELKEVTNCEKPDFKEWSYVLEPSIVTLEPSHNELVVLTVSTACSCQDGCKATIIVTGISSGNQDLSKFITTYTTRGPNKRPPGDPGVVIDINYDKYTTKLFLEKPVILDVEMVNTQNSKDTFYVWVSQSPENWSVSVSPTDLTILGNSRKMIKLNFVIPKGTSPKTYTISLRAQSQKSSNVGHKDTIKITIKPDIIIENVVFSKSEPRAGESVSLSIKVANIGLAFAKDIPLVIYDQLNYSLSHELNRQTISRIDPNQTINISYTWHPETGEYNLVFRIDPDKNLNELRSDNNIRIEPIFVKESEESEQIDESFYFTFILVFVLIIAWLIIYFIYSNKQKAKREQKRKIRSEEDERVGKRRKKI